NLRLRAPDFVEAVDRTFAQQVRTRGFDVSMDDPAVPMFQPFRLREMVLENRVVVAPMDTYSARDGIPGDWHLVHYGARATGGAGLVVTEMTCVSPHGRITPGCTGLWNRAQRDAWRRIVDFVHGHSTAKFCLQIGHSGRKGSTQLGWEQADHPLADGNWETLAPSALPYLDRISARPREMTRGDMDEIREQFVQAAAYGAD